MPDTKASAVKPAKDTLKKRRPAKPKARAVKPLAATPLPPVFDAITSSPQELTPLMAATIPTLTRTTYNSNRVKLLITAGSLLLMAGAVGTAWLYRDYLAMLWPASPQSQSAAAQQLKVTHESVDARKAAAAVQQAQLNLPSASQSAQSSESAEPAYVAEYVGVSDQDLQASLNSGIQALHDTQPYTEVLKSYQDKIASLESSDPAKARLTLMEAVQLSKEFQALYLYYKK